MWWRSGPVACAWVICLRAPLGPRGDQLDRLGPLLGQEPQPEPAGQPRGVDQLGGVESAQDVPRPVGGLVRGVELVDLEGGQEPVLREALHDRDRDRRQRPDRGVGDGEDHCGASLDRHLLIRRRVRPLAGRREVRRDLVIERRRGGRASRAIGSAVRGGERERAGGRGGRVGVEVGDGDAVEQERRGRVAVEGDGGEEGEAVEVDDRLRLDSAGPFAGDLVWRRWRPARW